MKVNFEFSDGSAFGFRLVGPQELEVNTVSNGAPIFGSPTERIDRWDLFVIENTLKSLRNKMERKQLDLQNEGLFLKNE